MPTQSPSPLATPPGTDLPTLITAIAAGVAAIAALLGLVIEGRRIRRQIGIDNMWRLIEVWDNPEMRRVRALVARRLLRRPGERRRVSDDGVDILNTFELLAYLVVRSKTLGIDDAWINFSGWAISWWYVYEEGIKQLRQKDNTVWEDYAKLVELFLEYESKERSLPVAEVIPTEENIRAFLEWEHRLLRRTREEGQLESTLREAWNRFTAGGARPQEQAEGGGSGGPN